MRSRNWPQTIDERLQCDIESLLSELGIAYQCEPQFGGQVLRYAMQPAGNITPTLVLELTPDQLNVNLNGCSVGLELAAHVPKLRKNARAFEDWRTECLQVLRQILTSDLRVETRVLGRRVVGGSVWRFSDGNWILVGGGGCLLMGLGRKAIKEYRNWW